MYRPTQNIDRPPGLLAVDLLAPILSSSGDDQGRTRKGTNV